MKRFARVIFNLACSVSLCLFLLVLALWLFSEFRVVSLAWQRQDRQLSLMSDTGLLVYTAVHVSSPAARRHIWGIVPVQTHRHRLGPDDLQQSWTASDGTPVSAYSAWVPYWLLAAVFFILPLLWATMWIWRRRPEDRVRSIPAAYSLLICIVLVVLWARSYFVHDLVYRSRHTFRNLTMIQESYQYESSNGGVSLSWGYNEFTSASEAEAAGLRQRSGYMFDNQFRTQWQPLGWGQYAGIDRKRERLWLGFGYGSLDTRQISFPQPVQIGKRITLPWAFPFLLFAILPAIHFRRITRQRRRLHRLQHNLCPNCAYDLRASTDRCPECGTPIPAGAKP